MLGFRLLGFRKLRATQVSNTNQYTNQEVVNSACTYSHIYTNLNPSAMLCQSLMSYSRHQLSPPEGCKGEGCKGIKCLHLFFYFFSHYSYSFFPPPNPLTPLPLPAHPLLEGLYPGPGEVGTKLGSHPSRSAEQVDKPTCPAQRLGTLTTFRPNCGSRHRCVLDSQSHLPCPRPRRGKIVFVILLVSNKIIVLLY